MSDEQRAILQMVSDGKISADDGAKLLEALNRGKEKRREMESPASRFKRRKRMMFTRESSEPPTDIGHMVMSVVHNAMNGIKHDLEEPEVDSFDFDEAESSPLDGDLVLEEGTELFLRRSGRNRMKPGDVVLIGVEGSICRLLSGAESGVIIDREDNAVRLRWSDGDLVLEVPSTVSRVMADIMGGDLVTNGLDASVHLRSKGGDIVLLDTGNAFDAKTMGGNLMITLTGEWDEDSRISTMGGNITLGVQSGTAGLVSARTLGGTITVSEELGEVNTSSRPGSNRVRVELSEGSESPSLRMKTMGGDITIGLTEELEDLVREASEAVREATGRDDIQAHDEDILKHDEDIRMHDEILRTEDEALRARDELLRAKDEIERAMDEVELAAEEIERVKQELDEDDLSSAGEEDGDE